MATIQRNIKTFGTRSFVGEVAAAPSNYAPILSNEVDADLDTVYAAWNGGADTVNIKDGSITYAKLDPTTQLWRDTGTTLTPGASFTSRPVAGPSSGGDAFVWGTSTIKSRLLQAVTTGSHWSVNAASTNALDDPTKPAWLATFDTVGDAFNIMRAPAAASAVYASRLSVTSNGNVTAAGDLYGANLFTGSTANASRGNLSPYSSTGIWLGANFTFSPYETAKASWSLIMDTVTGSETTDVVYRAPSAGGGARTYTWSFDRLGNFSSPNSVRVLGSANGVKFQTVGSTGPDGFSNNIAFGWNGTLQARVDSTAIGTVTVTSDARVKINLAEDVPGLDAVLAMRPISFEFDQTKREIGFPQGRHYGLIAQEVDALAPLAVGEDASEDHWKELDYRALVPVLIQAIQDLAQQLKAAAA